MTNTELTLHQLQTVSGGVYMDENGFGCIDARLVEFLKRMGWDPSRTVETPDTNQLGF